MKYRKTRLLENKPKNWMLWGINERFKWVLRELPNSTVFLYVTRKRGVGGGLALYGTVHEIVEIKERYWPEGVWRKAFYLEIRSAAPEVLEKPESPSTWKLVSRKKLAEIGIRILPGPQKIREKEAEKLKLLLKFSVRCTT